jgi:hypothetical protein
MLDPGALRVPSSPTPEKVMGAMLRTDSGSASVVRPTPTTSPDTSAAVARPGMARSLGMLHTNSGADEWGQDTIADASPLPDPTKAPSLERAVITQPPRSLLVEAGVGDRTAEDGAIVSQPAAATPADEPDQA